MTDVFISYSRMDRAIAARLAEALESRLITVWWDTDLIAQDNFRGEIERAIDNASAALVLWSDSARESRFVNDEAHRAQEAGKLIQITLDGAPPPMGYGGAYEHIVDLSDWAGETDAQGFAGLLTAVQRRLPDRSEIAGLKADLAALRAEVGQATQSGGYKTAPAALGMSMVALILSAALAYAVWGGGQPGEQVASSGMVDTNVIAQSPADDGGREVGTLLTSAANLPMTPEQALDKTGEWLEGWKEGYAPRKFQHFFIYPKGNKYVAPGAIVTGHGFQKHGTDSWDIQYGYHSRDGETKWIEGHEVTYLGPFWQPWYQNLSDTLNKLKGGRTMKEFQSAPGAEP